LADGHQDKGNFSRKMENRIRDGVALINKTKCVAEKLAWRNYEEN